MWIELWIELTFSLFDSLSIEICDRNPLKAPLRSFGIHWQLKVDFPKGTTFQRMSSDWILTGLKFAAALACMHYSRSEIEGV